VIQYARRVITLRDGLIVENGVMNKDAEKVSLGVNMKFKALLILLMGFTLTGCGAILQATPRRCRPLSWTMAIQLLQASFRGTPVE